MTPADREALAAGLAALGLGTEGALVDAFVRYADEIALWNPRLKLVAAQGRELVVRHLLDCAAGAAVLAERGELAGVRRAADLGSGAGLPGIPFALVHRELHVDLVERSGRRAGFLRNAVAALGLRNARVVEADAARYAERVELVVHRAFRPLDSLTLEVSLRPLADEGVFCAYKGRRESIDHELAALGGAVVPPDGRSEGGAGSALVVPVRVPMLEEERHLVIFRRRAVATRGRGAC